MRERTVKITIIGAGSKGFGRTVLTDILAFPALRQDAVIALQDVNEARLKFITRQMEGLKEDYPAEMDGVTFESTTDQKKALADAKFVVTPFMVGGWEAYKVDLEVPFKYGVTQNVGDTLGPGGVFRFLRSVPVYKSVIEDLKDVGEKSAFQPLVLNYTNPMAMNTWYCNSLWPGSTVGLCHGVQGTSNQLRMYVGATPQEFSFLCAGINHMAWFLEVRFRDSTRPGSKWVDAYPIIWEHFREEPEIVGSEKLRWDVMKATGYYMTESSGHLSEYLPYYRKRADLLEKFRGAEKGFDSLEHAVDMKNFERDSKKVDEQVLKDEPARLKLKKHPSAEYVSNIINAIETGVPFRFNGNVMNRGQGLITNLPRDCCVEVPVFADAHGLHPQGGIELPTVCQALCTSNVMV
ncbi:MAG: family 4 glycosyl hydrolase, partial [Promethearchaeota archaeon]